MDSSEPTDHAPGAVMELCPECKRSTAAIHMRDSAKFKRVCCVCEARLAAEAKKLAGADDETGDGRTLRKVILAGIALLILAGSFLYWYDRDFLKRQHWSVSELLAKTPFGKPSQLSDQAVTLNLRSDVLFEFGSPLLKPAAEDELQQVATLLRKSPAATVVIRGYTDSIGTEQANQMLALKRAQSVRDWMITRGRIPAAEFSVEGLGAKDPVAPNTNPDGSDNPAGRAQNRRVTVSVTNHEA